MGGSLNVYFFVASGISLDLAIYIVLVLILSKEKDGLDLIFSAGNKLL
jgi:hypothetical protein